MKFTDEQARFAMRQVSLWLQARSDHEDLSRERGRLAPIDYVEGYGGPVAAKKAVLGQIRADVDHSALLYRLLRGRPLLPEPPPTEHSYPVYPDWPYGDDE